MLGGSASLLVPDARSPALSPDGTRIAFVRPGPGGADRIAAAPLADPSQVTFLTGDEDGTWNHRDPAWSPDSTMIAYAAQHALWIVSSRGGSARPLTMGEEYSFEPDWSPDGKYIYYSSPRELATSALWRIPVDGGPPVRLTTGSGAESSPSIPLDGSRLVYSSFFENYSLVLLDLDSGAQRILREECILSQPAIAPDKSHLLFISDREGRRFDLWLQTLRDGAPFGSPRRLTDQPDAASHPAYSPDGKWIAYYQRLERSRNIFILPSAGGRSIQFTDDPAPDIQPAWSPDGSLIAFVSEREEEGHQQIWLARVANGSRTGPSRQLTKGDISAFAPVFSPDGTEIVFVGQKGSESDVWIVPVDGGRSPRRVTYDAHAGRLRWNGATNKILVSGDWGTNRVSLKQVSPQGGALESFVPEVIFGFGTPYYNFDISPDGRLLCHMRQERRGNIWVLDAESGSY